MNDSDFANFRRQNIVRKLPFSFMALPKETDKNNDNTMKKVCSPEETRKESSLLTDKEMNELGAKLLKAEMLGNLEEVEKLESKLEGARKNMLFS
ncbi:CWF19-like protein 2 [Centruroides sculpturatus]|uniref:CWF19-like protein 2 n=1 Tax=Centruroides sculpturatus TaxID=218467 RepID=UPI000C6E8B1E|nr:CWF19-like protein 2 [Centruroides sculpturatus]